MNSASLRGLKALLAAVCVFTLLATIYLSLSLAILRPPRVNYVIWSVMATLFAVQSGLTLFSVAGPAGASRMRWLLVAGALALIGIGGWWALSTLSASHFEGYALVLGSAVAVQGLLTLTARRRSL